MKPEILKKEIRKAVAKGKREIDALIARGVLPPTPENFSVLHDYVDANDLGGAENLYLTYGLDESSDIVFAAQSLLDAWLRRRCARIMKEAERS